MIVRIVTMHFREDAIDAFMELFAYKKEAIRQQPGCTLLELYQDKNNPQKFSTYSYWNTEEDLNNYRESALFNEVWPRTKVLFDKKPEATSFVKIHSLL